MDDRTPALGMAGLALALSLASFVLTLACWSALDRAASDRSEVRKELRELDRGHRSVVQFLQSKIQQPSKPSQAPKETE